MSNSRARALKSDDQVVVKADQIIKTKLKTMTPEDWRAVGMALVVGRKMHPSTTAFSAWLKERGWDKKLTEHERAEAQWLVPEENWQWFLHPADQKRWDVRQARAAKNRADRQEKGALMPRVRNTLRESKVPLSATDVAIILDADQQAVSKCFDHMRRGGEVDREGSKSAGFTYTLAPPRPKTEVVQGRRSKGDLDDAVNQAHMKAVKIIYGQITPSADSPDRMTRDQVLKAVRESAASCKKVRGGAVKHPKNGYAVETIEKGDQRPGNEVYKFTYRIRTTIEVL